MNGSRLLLTKIEEFMASISIPKDGIIPFLAGMGYQRLRELKLID